MEIPKVVKIKRIITENPIVKTFFLDKKFDSKPGQFFMVWLPGVDEKPFVLSYPNAFTIEKKGKFTKAMFKVKKGTKIGVRGPYGNGFSLRKNACVVAGGLGIVPLMALLSKLKNPVVICGSKSSKYLLFSKRLMKYKPHICTDDGSFGFHGFTTQMLEKLLKRRKFDAVYAVGPEIMMKKVVEICEKHKIYCEVSLERMMFCGLGICGSCSCGDKLVCKDGPVFDSKQIKGMKDFGKSALLRSGKKVSLKEYYK